MGSDTDKGDSLSCIARQQGQPVISILVDIGNNTGTAEKRTLRFVQNLECLRLPKYSRGTGKATAGRAKVLRETIDAARDSRYLALSYTWYPSAHERDEKGLYLVQKRYSQEFEPQLDWKKDLGRKQSHSPS